MTTTHNEFAPTDRAEWNTVYAHKSAVDVITKIHWQAVTAHQCWKSLAERTGREEYAKQALECLTTATYSLAQLFSGGFGDVKVTADSGQDTCLSLYARTESNFVYGVIFHRTHRPDPEFAGSIDVPMWMGGKPPMVGRFCKHDFDSLSDLCLKPLGQSSKYDVTVATSECEDHGHQEQAFLAPVLGTWSFHS